MQFVYSNSWDHSYDFDRCLTVWMDSLRTGGRCFLSWTRLHADDGVHDADCLGLSLPELAARIHALGYVVKARYRWWKKLFAGRLRGIARDYVDFLREERRLAGPHLKMVTLAIAASSAVELQARSVQALTSAMSGENP